MVEDDIFLTMVIQCKGIILGVSCINTRVALKEIGGRENEKKMCPFLLENEKKCTLSSLKMK